MNDTGNRENDEMPSAAPPAPKPKTPPQANTHARTPVEMHQDLKHYADTHGVALNSVLVQAFAEYLDRRGYPGYKPVTSGNDE